MNPSAELADSDLASLMRDDRDVAVRYYRMTGKPLGITGEIAEFEAATKLGLTLAPARTAFFDAVSTASATGEIEERFQIKGRAVSSDDKYRGRVPSIKCSGEFDAVLLVLLDRSSFDTIEIWRAERERVLSRLTAPGSRARNERGSLAIAQFKSIAERIWPLQET